MAKRLGIICLIFFAFVFCDYLWTQLSDAFAASNHGLGVPIGSTAVGPIGPAMSANSNSGLSSIHFDLFTKSGIGWSYVTQGYGITPYSSWYVGGWHNGIDIAANYGAPIFSPNDGTVIATGNQDNFCPGRGFGKFVAISDPAQNIVLWYAHLGTISVTPGQAVSKGTEIATIGETGLETGPHLHLSVFEAAGFSMKNKNGCGPDADGHDVNPTPYLQGFAN